MITCYENARVFTGGVQAADCFVVGEDGCFAFVGSAKDAHTAYPRAQRVDLGGRFVCPGFNDTHLHLLDLGCALSQAQLQEHTDSLAHVLDAVRTGLTAKDAVSLAAAAGILACAAVLLKTRDGLRIKKVG